MLVRAVYLATDVLLLLPLLIITAVSRLARRQVHVGLGPVPSINSRYHKQCLQRFGYRAETFVYHTWYLTSEFDISFQKYLPRALCPYVAYVFCLFRYQCLYTYFTGGPLGPTTLLARCEPYLLRLAGIKTVIMPFGADVHELTRAKNLALVDAYSKDYPEFRHSRSRTAALIDAWTHCASHIISGCDWVDFMYYWDTLMLTHFAIDTDVLVPTRTETAADAQQRPLRLLHAPNHRHLKGTSHVIDAVNDLRTQGVAIELSIVESLPNSQMSERIRAADVVIDQLIVGWYAMFALESMALGKPVVCYVRPDLRDFYIGAGLLDLGELPLIEASVGTIKEALFKVAALPRSELQEIGLRSRAFVKRRHSIEAVGEVFDRINRELGLEPRPL